MEFVTGNTEGLKSSQRRMLERIFRRRVDPHMVVSPELCAYLCECSREIDRQVGVLLERSGSVQRVIVGDAHKLDLPDLGRIRAGRGRFRGLRLIHTHLRGEPLTRDDLVDLAKLRFDLVAAIAMRTDGTAGTLACAHLLPENHQGELWRALDPLPIAAAPLQSLDFLQLIHALEAEFSEREGDARVVDGQERAVLVHVSVGRSHADSEARVAELKELCRTAALEVIDVVVQRRPAPDPKFLLGRGKLEEVVLRALQRDATALVFDPELSPTQSRSVSDATELKVIDRTMLILDIFAQHAKTRDGKLQVELAQLKYTLPRLVEKNTMMSRLTGGIGGRGPGETKLEINRRRARDRITLLERDIEKLSMRRGQRRSLRGSRELPIVAIVGYTNAGKSTLLNSLTDGDVLAEDKLFATLDPTSRRLRLPLLPKLASSKRPPGADHDTLAYHAAPSGNAREIILTDTVGFIRDLPKDLVNAFRATLEELDEADLLLHVVDASDPDHEAHIAAVTRILSGLHLDGKRTLLLFNKSDRLDPEQAQALARGHRAFAISAPDRGTFASMLAAVEQILWEEDRLFDRARPSV